MGITSITAAQKRLAKRGVCKASRAKLTCLYVLLIFSSVCQFFKCDGSADASWHSLLGDGSTWSRNVHCGDLSHALMVVERARDDKGSFHPEACLSAGTLMLVECTPQH